MKFTHLAAAAALAVAGLSAPAMAQVSTGATVYGPQGNPVGTVKTIQGGNVVVDTGNLEATLPESVFGEGENGPTIGWDKATLENEIRAAEQQAAQALEAAIAPGTQLYSVDGQVVGTIKEMGENGMIVVTHVSAGDIQLPKDQMTLQGQNLTFLATAADLEAAVSAQAGG